MRWAFTRSSETVKQPVLCYAFVWFSRACTPHTLTGRGKSPFHPLRSRCFVRGVLIYIKIRADLQSKKFHFSGLQFIQLPLVRRKKITKYRTPRVSTLKHQSLSCLFCTFDKTMSYWILGPLRSTSYKIIVPHTQLAIRWFAQMTKTLKTEFFFIFLPYVPKRPRGKSPELRAGAPGAEGIVRTGRLKLTTNFSMFFLVCVCACVCVCMCVCVCVCERSICGRVKQ